MIHSDAVITRILISLFLGAFALFGQQAPLRVLSSNGIRAVVEQVLPQAEGATGRKFALEFATSTALRQRIAAGEAFDVALLTSEPLDAMVAAGKIDGATRVNLANSGIAVGIRKGARKPDLRTPEVFKQTLIAAKSITYAQEGASRAQIEKIVQQFGIAAEVKAKTIFEPSSTGATEDVVKGKAELVLTLASEIIPVAGLDFAGLLPKALQNYVTIGAGISPLSKNRDAGLALIRFLSSSAINPALKANGMQRK